MLAVDSWAAGTRTSDSWVAGTGASDSGATGAGIADSVAENLVAGLNYGAIGHGRCFPVKMKEMTQVK